MPKTKCGTLAVVLATSLLTANGADAFKIMSKNGREVRWKKPHVEYYLQEEGPRSFMGMGYDGLGEYVTLRDIIDRSFETWKSVADADLDYSYAGTVKDRISGDDGKNVISFIQSGWADLPFNPPAAALAVTVTTYDVRSGRIIDADIYFNDEIFEWAHIDTEAEEEKYVVDIQNVATHEIGHVLGLDHSSESPFESRVELRSATMYYSSYAGDTQRRMINEDDMNGIAHLYPSRFLEKTVPIPELWSIEPGLGYDNGPELTVTIEGSNFGPLTMIKLVGPTRDDTVCKILSYTESYVECSFDLYHTNRGQYDLVAANTYAREDVIKSAFTVYGREIEQPSYGGGCGSLQGFDGRGSHMPILAMIILIFPITVLLLRRKSLSLEYASRKNS